MPTGRKPAAPATKLRRGNPGHRPVGAEIVVGTLENHLPAPPDDLAPAGRAAWALVGAPLAQAGILQESHLTMLRLFAQAVELVEVAWIDLHEDGLLRPGTKTAEVISPHFRVWEAAVAKAIQLGEQLGASPVSMARLGLVSLKANTVQGELAERYGKAD